MEEHPDYVKIDGKRGEAINPNAIMRNTEKPIENRTRINNIQLIADCFIVIFILYLFICEHPMP